MSIIVFIFFLFLLTFAWGAKQGAPWVPSKAEDVERFLSLANLKSGQVMYDLGCGDGRFVCAAAARGARAVGFEISLFPYLLAQMRRFFLGTRENCKISYKNFWSADLRDADVVYFFLMQKIYPRLKEKLETELRPGAKVIAYVWPVDGWEPKIVSRLPRRPSLFLYEIA